ncbi:MAG: BlaI/MecI/CopY family transcriptional regulator [Bacillota bacterium]|nr:BlaI/MecI/CopY family transcriptional regulator [Bacillota bacterium]
MNNIKIFDAEFKFMCIIWDNEPIKSTELVKKANEELGWKKSTTFTVIRRLCERGAISNKNTVIEALIKRENVIIAETEEHIEKLYGGSLKLFFSTFLQKEKLTKDEIEELIKIVQEKTGKEE